MSIKIWEHGEKYAKVLGQKAHSGPSSRVNKGLDNIKHNQELLSQTVSCIFILRQSPTNTKKIQEEPYFHIFLQPKKLHNILVYLVQGTFPRGKKVAELVKTYRFITEKKYEDLTQPHNHHAYITQNNMNTLRTIPVMYNAPRRLTGYT